MAPSVVSNGIAVGLHRSLQVTKRDIAKRPSTNKGKLGSARPWSASSSNGYIQQLEEEHLQTLSYRHHHGQDQPSIPGPGTYKYLRDLVQAWLQILGILAPKPPLPQNIAKRVLKTLRCKLF
jgi:hypothetical protein